MGTVALKQKLSFGYKIVTPPYIVFRFYFTNSTHKL